MKEINEKTFELNITNELLNLSKSWFWYLHQSPIRFYYSLQFFKNFLNQSVIFAHGLSQAQEAHPDTGGYDVSINFINPNNISEVRLMYIQYKAGFHSSYCNNSSSKFNRKKNSDYTEHVMFSFNDDSKNQQHRTLCNLARKQSIAPNSVIYAFPRITKYSEFIGKVGNLINHTSFVPALEINKQGFSCDPKNNMEDNKPHKYRTSYDGNRSEVNYYYFGYNYNQNQHIEILGELVCIQIQRYAELIINNVENFGGISSEEFTNSIEEAVDMFIRDYLSYRELKYYDISYSFFMVTINNYLKKFIDLNNDVIIEIPKAPSAFTSVLSKDGILLNFENKNVVDFNYQIF